MAFRQLLRLSGHGQAAAASSSRLLSSNVVVLSKEIVVDVSQLPTITAPVGQAFPGDLRSTSGLGLGDGIIDHTSKWLQVGGARYRDCACSPTAGDVRSLSVICLWLCSRTTRPP